MIRPSRFFYAILLASPFLCGGQGRAAEFPDGAGRELVEGVCTGCHEANQITRSSGYGAEHWKTLIGTMIDLSGSPAEQEQIVQYLAAQFPPNDKRKPVIVPGDATVSFKEWVAPTLGQRARDPVEAPDRSIWWVGQFGNVLGRIDPATGELKEYPLPDGAKPHSVNIDGDGQVWYLGNGNGTIGRFDPKTGETTVFAMPDPAARDPHTGEFDRQGIFWFTLQQSNMIGRLDPKTGDVRLVTVKRDRARPYGIKIDAEGTPWVACNGSNCLIKVDPKTMALTEIDLPLAGTTVRRLDIAADGIIWYVNSGEGRLGRFDPKTGAIREWPSPSGPDSHPYAIAVIDGIVWYNESGKRPDMLVRFDPRTEKFQSWPIPSGSIHAGIIRHMRPTHDGNLLIHQSSTNRIMLVTLPAATE
jgi:virginiamycin B lyase